MTSIDILSLVPDPLKQAAIDALIDLVSGEAKKLLGDEIATKIKRLRSDAKFQREFDKGIQKALNRFIQEYETEDEDLVAALASNKSIFLNEDVRSTLLTMLKHPSSYLVDDRERLSLTFVGILPERK